MLTTQDAVLAATEALVRERLGGHGGGHDWFHTERVTRMARRLAEAEGGNPFVVQLAALLHDIADYKFSGDEEASGRAAAAWLTGQGVAADVVDHVVEIINTLSFKSVNQRGMRTVEGQCVQDADRLDAIGAIGIGRAFAYGGYKNRLMHDPAQPPRLSMTPQEYRANQGSTINHFHEKLLHLRDLMNTPTARRLAEARHQTMVEFLARFEAEWQGLD